MATTQFLLHRLFHLFQLHLQSSTFGFHFHVEFILHALNIHGLCLFTVWLELMLPVLNIHGLSSFCVHFIETLLRFVSLNCRNCTEQRHHYHYLFCHLSTECQALRFLLHAVWRMNEQF